MPLFIDSFSLTSFCIKLIRSTVFYEEVRGNCIISIQSLSAQKLTGAEHRSMNIFFLEQLQTSEN